MSKFFVAALIVIALGIGFLGNSALAAEDPFGQVCDATTQDSPVCDQNKPDNPITGEDGILVRATQIVVFIVGVASVIMVLIGGFKYITSNGDANGISNAKNTILYALIGVVLASVSQIIIIFVISRL